MENMRMHRSWVWTGLFGVLLLALMTPAAVLAKGSSSPEPGAGCGVTGYKYDGPPFLGTVTVTYQAALEGTGAYMTGTLEQMGGDCAATFSNVFLQPMTVQEFKSIKASDLRGFCNDMLKNLSSGSACALSTDFSEVLGAGNLKWGPGKNSFTVLLVVMPLRQQ